MKRTGVREQRGGFPATLEAMERFIAGLGLRNGWFPHCSDAFAAELLLREILSNAVLHGSSGEGEGRVLCAVRRLEDCLEIVAHDDGPGFDWRAALGRDAGAVAVSGRGLEILRSYSTAFRFNARGNAVSVRRQFGMELPG
jgi:anti-sigma regulatory factor (Ser/Thr protein kinase)